MKHYRLGISVLLLSLFSGLVMADEKLDGSIASLQHEWAKANTVPLKMHRSLRSKICPKKRT